MHRAAWLGTGRQRCPSLEHYFCLSCRMLGHEVLLWPAASLSLWWCSERLLDPQMPFLRQWSTPYLHTEQKRCVIQSDREDAEAAVSNYFKLALDSQGWILLERCCTSERAQCPAGPQVCTLLELSSSLGQKSSAEITLAFTALWSGCSSVHMTSLSTWKAILTCPAQRTVLSELFLKSFICSKDCVS